MTASLKFSAVSAAMMLTIAAGATQGSAATVLYDQATAAGTKGVPSQEFPEAPSSTSQAADDFVVPYGQHWAISALEPIGVATVPAVRTFNASLYEEFGGIRLGPGREIFSARNVAASGAPNYAIPTQGAPILHPGSYWVSAQASTASGDPWLWSPQRTLRGRPAIWQNPGNALGTDCTEWWTRESCLAQPDGEPDQAFRLIGTFKQVLTTGSYGNAGRVVSSPPGIDCPGTCAAAFDRGAVVTLTGLPLRPKMEFTGWRRGLTLPPSSVPVATPQPTDLPCPGVGKGPCQLTLNEDMTIFGTYEFASKIKLGKLKRHLGDGSAKLFVRLPVSGVLSLSGKTIASFREDEAKPGIVRLPLIPRGAAKRRLEKTGRATVSARIKFRAFGNTAKTVVRQVTLRQKLRP